MKASILESGLLRLKSIIAPGGPLPISKSQFYLLISAGVVPRPTKLGSRCSAWRAEDIRKLVEEGIPRAGLATRSGDRS